MRIAVLGRTSLLYNTIDKLIDAGHEVVLIGTCPASKECLVNENDFRRKAVELNVPFFCDHKINQDQYVRLFSSLNAQLALSVNWITVIGEKIISCFPMGILNAHCGDLPQYRGNACPNWALLNNEKRIAICIHFMEPNSLDSGNIVTKDFLNLRPDTTISQIYEWIEKCTPFLFLKAAESLTQSNSSVSQSTNPSDILRCYPRLPQDSFIDWNKSCTEIDSLIRASCYPFDGAYTFCRSEKVHIMKCRIESFQTRVCVIPGQVIKIDKIHDEVSVATSDGIIVIEIIQINNKTCSVTSILNSTRLRLNYSVHDILFEFNQRLETLEKILSVN